MSFIKANPHDNSRTVYLFANTEEIKEYLKKEHNITY